MFSATSLALSLILTKF